jgi:hypothetical protein
MLKKEKIIIDLAEQEKIILGMVRQDQQEQEVPLNK